MAAAREMGGVGLSGEEAGRLIAQTHVELIESDVIAHLGYQAHTLGIMHLHVGEGGGNALDKENSGCRTFPPAQGHGHAGLKP